MQLNDKNVYPNFLVHNAIRINLITPLRNSLNVVMEKRKRVQGAKLGSLKNFI